jgi:thiamine-phosphate pyrophosphorylase
MSDATRLYLVTPPVSDPAAFRPLLDAALAAGDVACLHLRIAAAEGQAAKRFVQALAPAAQERGAAVLIDPPADWREVARLGADGVHCPDPTRAADALEAMKPDRIAGVGGLKSRDAAMTAGEAGVDYVMFGEPRPDGTVPPADQVIERCRWWAELFNTPCVGYAATPEMVAPLAAAGVEFVALGPWVFTGAPADVAAAVRQAGLDLKRA